jgi:hypothetical protein
VRTDSFHLPIHFRHPLYNSHLLTSPNKHTHIYIVAKRILIDAIDDCKKYGTPSSPATSALLRRTVRKLDTFAFVDLEDEVDTRLPVSVTLRKWTDNLKSSQAVPRLSNSTTGSYLRPEEPSVRIQNRKIDFEKLLCDLWPSFAYYSLSVNPEEPLFVTQRTLLIFMQDCGIVYDSQEEEEEEEEDGRLWKHTARLMISKIIDDSGLDESDREGKSIGFRRFVVLLSRIAMRIYGVVRTLLFPHTHTCTHTHTHTDNTKEEEEQQQQEGRRNRIIGVEIKTNRM